MKRRITMPGNCGNPLLPSLAHCSLAAMRHLGASTRRWIVVAALAITPAMAEPPAATLDAFSQEWIEPDHPLALELSRWPSIEEGRLAILIDQRDATDLFRRVGARLEYRPNLLPLPRGESEIIVFLVAPDGAWSEIARHPLKVLHAGGFEETTLRPTLDIEIRSTHDPEVPDSFDPSVTRSKTTTRGTGRIGFDFATARDGWSYSFQSSVLGVSKIEEAIRFSTEGESAPRLDLTNYLVTLSRDATRFELGHVSFGQSRQLLDNFASRGLGINLPLGQRVVVGGAALNGTQIVGWDNPFGLSRSEHRIYAGTVAAELLPRPGGLQIGGTFLDASVLPLSAFDQGALTDREESSGWSTRLTTSTAGGRFALRGGFARSRFDNPVDPFLAQGEDLVAVQRETRDARYAEVDLGLVRGTMGGGQPFSLDLSLRHQRVDPLYRSIGAFVASDIEENGGDLRATLGQFTAQLGHVSSHDNLDGIPSVLETKTRRRSGSLFLPLAALGQTEEGRERRWMPALSYTYGRTRQFSDKLPIDGGFSPGHLPDQISLTHGLSMDWQGNLWRLNATFGTSDQDNRQPGREENDFEARTGGLNLSLTPHPQLDLSLAVSDEQAESRAAAETDNTFRTGLNLSWRPLPGQSVEVIGSRSETDNSPRTRESTSSDFSLQWSWQFARGGPDHGFSSQLTLLYSWQSFESRDLVFGFADSTDRWTLSAGLNLSFH